MVSVRKAFHPIPSEEKVILEKSAVFDYERRIVLKKLMLEFFGDSMEDDDLFLVCFF